MEVMFISASIDKRANATHYSLIDNTEKETENNGLLLGTILATKKKFDFILILTRNIEIKKTNKIVGVGMSKTGTSTLAACLDILSIGPHKSFDRELKESVINQKNKDIALKTAENYKSFEDSPWYHLYQEMDQQFPGSKFILTVRKDSYSHAKSSWFHGVQTGSRSGEPTEEYLQEKTKIYENHNNAIKNHFKNRPDDLLILCWEKGDNWPESCNFLAVDVPNALMQMQVITRSLKAPL